MAMTLRLAPEIDDMLTQIAQQEGISKQQAVALAIEEYGVRNGLADKFEDAYQRMMARYSGLIDELSRT